MDINNDTFFRVISPEHLYASALVFGVLTFIIVLAIYIYLYTKKRRYRLIKSLNDVVDDWIGDLLAEDELAAITVPRELEGYINRSSVRKFVIEKLINVKKNISGQSGKNIELVYVDLGLINDSKERMKSHIWHVKAKGIYELYMMDQSGMYHDILKYTNHGNRFVRREAQAAIIGFAGFNGLVFLDTLTQPMLEWQQLKLIEQLQTENLSGLEHLPLWLQSDNIYVVQFALKLAYIYQQYDAHDAVVDCLAYEDEKLRRLAIKALGNIAAPETAGILIAKYSTETVANKKTILVQLGEIGSEDDFDFLMAELNNTDDDIKLEVVRAIVNIDRAGWDLLKERMNADPVLEMIGKQVKMEKAA